MACTGENARRWAATVLVLFTALASVAEARACSPAGHAFVAAASIGRLRQSHDPEVQKLAAILHNYRWVVYWAAEGPDVVQEARQYRFSHWARLYTVHYEHPERFQLATAMPYYQALFRHAYQGDYGVTAEDVAQHRIALARQPRPGWNEVGLAYACGYVTHLISDYFCHYPAKVWWDHEPKLPVAARKICNEDEYGVIQEFYAVMLWERFAQKYGLPADAENDLRSQMAVHHVDNAILPYCALACSKRYYDNWPAKAREAADPSKYDACAAPMLHRAGKGAGSFLQYESKRVHAMLDSMGLPFDQAIDQSNRLTGWQDTYGRVIEMIVAIWSQSAPQLRLEKPGQTNVVLTTDPDAGHAGSPIALPAQPGSSVSLAPHRPWAIARYVTRKSAEGSVTEWGQQPSGARFDLGVVPIDGRNRVAILTDGPYLLGAGCVRGSFRLRLPATEGRITFRALCGQPQENTARSDGVTFGVCVLDGTGHRHDLFRQHVRREFRPASADLTPFAGQEVELLLEADSGPHDDFGWDTGAWVEPVVALEAANRL